MNKPCKKNLCSDKQNKMITVKITNSCNMDCNFCIDKIAYQPKGKVEIEKMAEIANSKIDFKAITLTGGEPFLNNETINDVVEFCKLVRKNKRRIIIHTNGYSLLDKDLSVIKGLIDEVYISIHDADPIINRSVFINGNENLIPEYKENYFQLLKKKIQELHSFGIQVLINSIFSKINNTSCHLTDMFNLASYLEVDKLRILEVKGNIGDEFFELNSCDLLKDNDEETKELNKKIQAFFNRKSKNLLSHGCSLFGKYRNIFFEFRRLCQRNTIDVNSITQENLKNIGCGSGGFACCRTSYDNINGEGRHHTKIDTTHNFGVLYQDGSFSYTFKRKIS